MAKENLQNSPLHGLSAEIMLTELVTFYGWEVLDAAIDLKCFRIKPTVPSSLAFLKKAEWARNRVEDFYLYQFKGMPKPNEEELELKPRERGFPDGVVPKEPRKVTADKVKPVFVPPREKPVVVEDLPEVESTFKSRFSSSRFKGRSDR